MTTLSYSTTHFPNGREASPYQQEVFSAALHGDGDLVVTAAPGSGKSTTLKQVARLLLQRRPSDRVAYLAFSKAIADEMRPEMPGEVTVATIHSQGYKMVTDHLGGGGKPDQWKYSNPIREMLAEERLYPRKSKAYAEVSDAIKSLVDMTRVKLIEPRKNGTFDHADIERVAEERGIEIPKGYDGVIKGIVAELLFQGVERAEARGEIDFTDMLWLPHVWDLKPKNPFDAVLVDEAQDLSRAQLELVLKLARPGGRRVFVADPMQAIFQFAGAESDSVEQIIKRTKAEVLPLSITYRCPASHVRIAQQINPEVQAADGAAEGEVGAKTDAEFYSQATPGDIVLCRTTRPLVAACFEMLRAGKPATIRGKDIGADLAKLARKVAETIPRYGVSEMLAAIDVYAAAKEAELTRRAKSDDDASAKVAAMRDRVEVLALFVEETPDAKTVDAVTDRIARLFDDRPGGSISFMTMHRAKGLEAEVVWILQPELMPHPMAKTPAERHAEACVEYVAVTRSKRSMWFVGEYRRLPAPGKVLN